MKKMMIATLAAASVLLAVANQAHAGATLDAVQKKGFVQCGISDGLPGFSYADADGKFSGIDVDVKIIADPKIDKNTHEIHLKGSFGELITRTANVSSPDNPKTSMLAAFSAACLLNKLSKTIQIGS